ncbi:hypothetical protein [Rugamonas rubra]|uniref:hypothetical protein n=1 Tax=Rugamonas rubra TaxID=758825 RepID=UPI0011144248|nr:hypothetical protein [Rugamonas rubra]
MPFIREFEEGIVQPIERLLEGHYLTQQFFQGHLYLAIAVDVPFPGMDIERPNGRMTTLDAKALGRLCMIPDQYVVSNLRRHERGPIPAGIAIQSIGPFLPEQDVRQRDPAWWPNRGWPCDMCFDLTAGSRSWRVLLEYLFATLAGDAK